MAGDSNPSHEFPAGFVGIGMLSGAGAAYFVARIVYAAWAQRPQVVAVAYLMFHPLTINLLFFGLWLVASLLWTIVASYRGSRIRPLRWAALSLGVVMILIPFVLAALEGAALEGP